MGLLVSEPKFGLVSKEKPEWTDPRAKDSNYLPFDVPVGKASDYPDTKDGRGKMLDKLKKIRIKNNPVGKGYGLEDL